MHTEIQAIRSQLNRSRNHILQLQNVVATGIGYKTTGGKVTSALSIICSVEQKLPKNRIPRADQVPPFIRNISTDVQPAGHIRPFQKPEARIRPVPCGVSTGHYRAGTGTLGCLVKKDGLSYILSNNHVFANCNEASVHDPILQPGPEDGGEMSADQIAELIEYIPLIFSPTGYQKKHQSRRIKKILHALALRMGNDLPFFTDQPTGNKVDCAIARPLQPDVMTGKILEIGSPVATKKGVLGMAIKKSGRTTGLTTDIIRQTDVTVRINYGRNKTALFTDQLLTGPMSRYGDSGSAVLDTQDNLVGLLFAGSEQITLINRIEHVFASLGVELDCM
jgi:hypothetical protein